LDEVKKNVEKVVENIKKIVKEPQKVISKLAKKPPEEHFIPSGFGLLKVIPKLLKVIKKLSPFVDQ